MTTHTTGIGATNPDTTVDVRVDLAARQMYEAELALHDAYQSHVNAWIAAASEKLHQAVVAHLTILAEQHTADTAP